MGLAMWAKCGQALPEAGVSIAPSTYYAACNRPVSAPASRDEEVTAVIKQIHAENYGVYGVRTIYAELVRRGGVNGRPVARCTVARLMKAWPPCYVV
ncbi:HTH-like domain-containing protein [Cryptosporangium aurantiacum]|uniref:HTH-like domain-containing protein n=1 Tax=Cryptosporangium aurantiacum TaxID=134849 RepID=A0A1M7Q7V8_9ACTN|nr:HTH-like domain-containing protein [Cryptosporangium aurantiacum]